MLLLRLVARCRCRWPHVRGEVGRRVRRRVRRRRMILGHRGRLRLQDGAWSVRRHVVALTQPLYHIIVAVQLVCNEEDKSGPKLRPEEGAITGNCLFLFCYKGNKHGSQRTSRSDKNASFTLIEQFVSSGCHCSVFFLTAIVSLPLVDVGVRVGLLQSQDPVDGVARLPLLQEGLGNRRELRPRGQPAADRRRVGGRRRRGHLLLLFLGRRGGRGAAPATAHCRAVVTRLGPLRRFVPHDSDQERERLLRPCSLR